MQTRIGDIENAIIFLPRAFRIVAQPLYLVSGRRPGAVQVNALLGEYRLIVAQKLNFVLVIEIADNKTRVAQARFRHDSHHITVVFGSYLNHRPQFLIEQNGYDALQKSSAQRFRPQFIAIDVVREHIET